MTTAPVAAQQAARTHAPSNADAAALASAEREILTHPAFASNPWFVRQYWPENRDRFLMMARDALELLPDGAGRRLLDVGCHAGAVSFFFSRLGFDVTGTDAEDVGQPTFFPSFGGRFFFSNLNELAPFAEVPDASFDVVLIGEVIEHVLNHPAGVVRSLARVLRPGGLLVLSTPNPSNVINALRILRGQTYMWGTTDFMDEPKVDAARRVTSVPRIHYREYTPGEMRELLARGGLVVERTRFLGMGSSADQSPLKRTLKALPPVQAALRRRLFASTQYHVARKPS